MTAFFASVVLAFPVPSPAVPAAIRHYAARDRRPAVVAPYRAKLERMAQCESTGRWHIATGNGFYGGLQFDERTWLSVGGRGYPHWASKLEQMYRAVMLIRRRGFGPWPVCGYR